MKARVLILCTGNSCRSQMAEGLLRSFDSEIEVISAGTKIAPEVHPKAIQVMKELNIDLSEQRPTLVDEYLKLDIDYVITVCGNAQESCPAFFGNVKHRLHIGFDDPADFTGEESIVLDEFRRVRDEINKDFGKFYQENIK